MLVINELVVRETRGKSYGTDCIVDPAGSSDALVGDEDRPLNVQDHTPLLKERNEQLESLNQTERRSN